ncbi:MAG TPA: gliding motility-associated C-terminal domain-containing protein, partial [Saprospiraceae bacterium]|nr:gliding motility-associated C-terminal domain-containing protein [Saprospiraceae bacterium]
AGQVALKITSGTGPVTYSLNGNLITGSIARGLSSGSYDFVGVNNKGCRDTVRGFTLIQSEPVRADFANIDSILCNGGKTCIKLTNPRGGSGRGYTYAVNFSRNIPIDSCFEVFSGRYRINVFDSEGCGDSLEITLGQPQRFEVSLGEDIVYQLGGTKPTISVTPSPGSSIINVNWSNPNFIQCVGNNCQVVQVQEYGNVELIADAVNQNGCLARGRIKLTLNQKENVFIPSVLKTDGQVIDFENTRWKITLGEGVESIKSLKILDRWGNVVHMQSNINNDYEGWDGLFNGKELPPGVYVYVAEIQFVPTGEKTESRMYSGSITLLR